MITILGRRSSINVRKVLWACAELGLPFEQQDGGHDLATWAPTSSGLAFTALNPNAMVPVLLDHDFVLWESNSILRYLANRYGDGLLYPYVAKDRARVDQWLDWQASDLNRSWSYAFMSLVRQSPGHADAAQVQTSLHAWARFMSVLEGRLMETGSYVAGTTFSLADIAVGLSVHRWFATPFDHPRLDAVRDYYQRVAQRPGFVTHCHGAP
ncbi:MULTISPECIES: glutathione S-transferase [unclassified Stenotrophomonas]|uniref:glutathione S-transferase family protein n=1 Tax=unclassified Stenotrophomonas TaxID=196198 RepID=UPI000D15F9F3|nr:MULTISPECIES: glutathione S-transferase [unclassified Stenotrophomonas]PTA70806.1 glutathione S-transferase [Stenotrophomonas sp. Nf1]PTA81254.1 glutathione S-transferase [Stenotrophomonas sp. Nf4]